jgi:hypothetical protein
MKYKQKNINKIIDLFIAIFIILGTIGNIVSTEYYLNYQEITQIYFYNALMISTDLYSAPASDVKLNSVKDFYNQSNTYLKSASKDRNKANLINHFALMSLVLAFLITTFKSKIEKYIKYKYN